MTTSAVVTARRLSRINSSYLQAKLLQTACDVGLFEWLGDRSATSEEICEHYNFKINLGGHFLDALTGLELLERTDDRYRNRAEIVPFLTSDSATYLGGSFRRHGELHYRIFAELEEALRLGAGKDAPISGEGMWFEEFDPVRAHEGFRNMDAFNGFTAKAYSAWILISDEHCCSPSIGGTSMFRTACTRTTAAGPAAMWRMTAGFAGRTRAACRCVVRFGTATIASRRTGSSRTSRTFAAPSTTGPRASTPRLTPC
jgi:hypothetical protein